MNDKKYPESVTIIATIIFLSWFLGSIAAMFYFFPKSAPIGMMFVGQFFAAFGFFMFFAKEKFDYYGNKIDLSESEKKLVNRPLGIMIILFGSIIVTFSCILEWGNENIIKILKENETPLFLVFLVVFALSFPIYLIWKNRMLSEKCCEKVVATVVDVAQTYSNRHVMYCPVISYEYNGNVFTVQTEFSNNFSHPRIGDVYDIFVNSNNPEEYKFPSQTKQTLSFFGIVALIFVIACGIGLYNFYF